MESKKRLWKGFAIFMAAMLLMTFVSRIVYVNRLPRVHWMAPTSASISRKLNVDGTVEVVNSEAVTGMEGLLVKKVCVAAGESVKAGTVLYEVDTEDLQVQLSRLEAEEQVWQEQVSAQKKDAATEIARAQEDYDTTVVELDRKIAEETRLLEDAMEDLDTHMFRLPKEDAPDEVWIAWADERTRIDREIEARKHAIEEAEFDKEKILKEAGRNIEDAKEAQSEVEGAYSAGYSAIGQIQERENKIEAWRQLLEDGGQIKAGQEGTILEVMLKSGVRMGADAVMRYAGDASSRIFRTIISQDQKSMVHTGDTVRLKFAGSSEETSETIDSIVQENGSYTVTIWLEPGTAKGRTEGTMEVTYTSQVYDYVVPRQAVHNDGGNCIYVLEEKNGILGTELSIRSMTVRLLDENDDNAAIADELLTGDLKIVTESDKELVNGAAVMEY
ncbi:MAG: biotin/lipoyl-binding protein [Eubacterium sp.]|nr:biotin/lipoyl-binding protein [Eubacterium sp.]